MCWSTSNTPQLKIVESKPIKVVKIVLCINGYFKPYFFSSSPITYEVGKTYKEENILKLIYSEFRTSIYEGFHSYLESEVEFTIARNQLIGVYNKCLKKFLNYYLSGLYTIHLMECNLPCGTEYYLNEQGEIVSNSIKILRINNELRVNADDFFNESCHNLYI